MCYLYLMSYDFVKGMLRRFFAVHDLEQLERQVHQFVTFHGSMIREDTGNRQQARQCARPRVTARAFPSAVEISSSGETMPQPLTPKEVFLELVHGVAEGRWSDLPRLYAEDAIVTHPFHPTDAPPLKGREALAAHFGVGRYATPPQMPHREPVNINMHQTTDPEVIIAEFAYRTTMADGTTMDYPCVFILRVRDGQIVTSSDYIDPIRRNRAFDRMDAFIDEIRNHW
jgi:uncharacterized protein